jgi:glutathione S-transferase
VKLYYSPAACSLASHIALNESGLKFTLEKVDLASHKYGGKDYYQINPKGYVPALELDTGEILTENAVIQMYVADQAPKANLLPKAGTPERYRALEWLTFVSTEIHKGLSPLWNPKFPDDAKQILKDRIAQRYDWLSKKLTGKYLLGDPYTVADGYLFTVLNWSKPLHIDLTKWPVLLGFCENVKARPATLKSLKEEGLV